MNRRLALLGAVLLAGCTNEPRAATQITYVRDHRTGLCFAFTNSGNAYGGHTFTNVPCAAVIGKATLTDLR